MRSCTFHATKSSVVRRVHLLADWEIDSFRNIYQYLDDCWVQGQEPRLPQLLLILHSAEVSLALPGPAWLALPISYAMGVVIGLWWGGYVLGYQASYPEYYDGSRESKKER